MESYNQTITMTFTVGAGADGAEVLDATIRHLKQVEGVCDIQAYMKTEYMPSWDHTKSTPAVKVSVDDWDGWGDTDDWKMDGWKPSNELVSADEFEDITIQAGADTVRNPLMVVKYKRAYLMTGDIPFHNYECFYQNENGEFWGEFNNIITKDGETIAYWNKTLNGWIVRPKNLDSIKEFVEAVEEE